MPVSNGPAVRDIDTISPPLMWITDTSWERYHGESRSAGVIFKSTQPSNASPRAFSPVNLTNNIASEYAIRVKNRNASSGRGGPKGTYTDSRTDERTKP
jgi:hypothetical protein